ncbi:MAG: hypothetical protein ACOX22_02700 [Caldicoprobacterales bacterium]
MLDLTPEQDSYVGVFSGHPHTKFAVDSLKRMEYTSIPPLTGPEGVCYSPMELTGFGIQRPYYERCQESAALLPLP